MRLWPQPPADQVKPPASLCGQLVKLRPVSAADYPLLFQWRSDSDSLHLWNISRRFVSYEQWLAELDEMLGRSMLLLILDAATEIPVGYVQAHDINPLDAWLHFSVYAIKEYRGQGHHLEAMVMGGDIMFDWYPVRKIYADIYEFNQPLVDRQRALGFVDEAFIPDHIWYKDRYWGLYRMALYREKWPEARTRALDLILV